MQKDPDVKKPQFKLPYQQCKTHYEKLNYICLNKQCFQHSLICSMCKDSDQHLKHQIRPLKFYLQQLQKKYKKSQKDTDLEEMLDQLQISQYTFYQKLKKSVQEVAEQFRKLQEQVTNQISKIRNQILQEISKRHKFNQFYQSLKKGSIDNSNFLIQNYLPQPSVGKLGNLQIISNVTTQLCEKIQQIKHDIVYRKSTAQSPFKNQKHNKVFSHLNLELAMKKPASVSFIGGVLAQTVNNVTKSLCLIDHPVSTLSGKLNFKIVQFKKGSQIILGALTKQVYESMGQHWQIAKLTNNCFALGNDGYKYGWLSNQISQFNQGSSLEIYCKAGQFKIIQKNKCALAKLPTQKQIFVFIVLTGQSQVRISHIK